MDSSWGNGLIINKEEYENRKKKYGFYVYMFQFSLINTSYDSAISLLFGFYGYLCLMVVLILYHVVCYFFTIANAYEIGRMDVVMASVHSVILAVFVTSTITSYYVYRKGIVSLGTLYKERLFTYKHYLPAPPMTYFEKLVDHFVKRGVIMGAMSLFIGVYVVAPLVDLRFWQTDCVRNGIIFCIALPMYHPYESDQGWKFYLSIFVQTFFGIYRISVFFSIQLTMTTWSQHLVQELSILRNSLENIEKRTEMEFLDRTGRNVHIMNGFHYNIKEFNDSAKFCLHENVKHHQNILSYFNKTNSILALPSFLAYMTGTLTMAIAMVKLLTAEGESTIGGLIAYCFVLSGEILFMVMISVVGEYITGMAEDVFTAVSHISIDKFDVDFRKSMLIFMAGTLNPIAMSSSKFNKCNHEALGNVFNAAYSFYNVTKASSMQ